MTGDEDVARRVLELLAELSKSVRVLVENQERLTSEQTRCARALGEAGGLLVAHGAALTQVMQHLGLLADDSDAPPSTPPY